MAALRQIKKFLLNIELIRKIRFWLHNSITPKHYNIINLCQIKDNKTIKICEVQSQEKEITFNPVYVENDKIDKEKSKEVNLPSQKVIKILNAKVIGGSNIIILNEDTALYNHNSDKSVNHSDCSLVDYKQMYELGNQNLYYNNTQILLNKAISFCINYCDNYYHYVLECIGKFYVLNQAHLPISIPIIIDQHSEKINQFKEYLDIFNKDKRTLIYVNPRQVISIKELYIFSPLHYLPANYKNINLLSTTSVVLNSKVINFIRQEVDNIINLRSTKPYRKIYISRTNYSNRSYNNGEIETCLKNNGFEIVYPETLSVREQIRIFNESKLIVGASGAALTNILYCRESTSVIVLANKKLNLPIFSSIAGHLKLKLFYLTDKCLDEDSLHSSFYISPEKLINFINKIQL